MNFSSEDLSILKNRLSDSSKIVITTHIRPDGDALGSGLGLWHFLKELGHEALMISSTSIDQYLRWLPGITETLIAPDQVELAKEAIKNADIVFSLDYNALSRAGLIKEAISETKAFKVMIDHHIDPEDWADLLFHNVKALSTAELVFQVIEEMGFTDWLSKDIAECLYTGIMTDTGSFRFPNTTPTVHRIVANLMEKGINVGFIHTALFDNFSENRMRLIGFCLQEKLRVLPEYKTAYIVISKAEGERFKMKSGDTEGLVNYNLAIQGINFGILIKESDDKVKMSFRSFGTFPCNEFAANFNGGGHHNASGGISFDSLEATEKKFLDLLDQFKTQLNY